jgi:hypothetical protein
VPPRAADMGDQTVTAIDVSGGRQAPAG